MSFKKPTITILFLAVWMSSCTHYYYVANIHNVPLFKEKNEYRFSGAYGEGNASSCVEVQAAYSVTGKIGITANFMTAKGGVDSENGKENYFEGAIGYYKPISGSGVFEIYGGLGGSNQHHQYGASKVDLPFMKIYIQPSFGFTYNTFDIAASARFCELSYNVNDNTIYEISALSNKTHLFLEPAITVRGGWKYVKVQFQAAFPKYLNNNRDSPIYFSEEYHISIGLYVTISERYRINGSNKK